jgi:hypothetical protein
MGTPQRKKRVRRLKSHERATLRDMSDRELMGLIAECEDDDGFVDTRAIVDVTHIVHDRPNTCVGSRMSWMARFGYIQKHPKQKGVWKINAKGRSLVSVPLSQHVPKADGAWASAVGSLAANGTPSEEARRFARREWRHYMERKVG